MSSDSFKVKNSLNIDPKASPTMDQNGDIAVDSSTNKLKVRLNGTTENVASEAYVDAHINDATAAHAASAIAFTPAGSIAASDVQTAVAEVATDAASALSTHESDTTNIHGIADTSILVTTTGSQVLTNKDIDGGTASNTSRITIPKDTLTNLTSLTRKQGTLVFDTTSNKPYYDDGSNLKVIGSGGGINLIDDGDGEAGVANYIEGSYSAATRPAGTFTPSSGSGTFSVSTTSSALFGNTSLLLTKVTGASRQGRAIERTISIDSGYQAKVLQMTINYEVVSGSFVAGSSSTDSSLIWYIGQWNGSAWSYTEPSSFKMLSNSTTISDVLIGNFQTNADTTQIKLIAYVAETASSDWVVKCEVAIQPCNYVYGTPITDWVAWTPTGSWTGAVTYGGLKRRVGDTYEYQVSVSTLGAPTGTNLTINLQETIDTNKIVSSLNKYVGEGIIHDNGTDEYKAIILYNNTTSVVVRVYQASGTYVNFPSVTPTSPMTWTNTDSLNLKFAMPIVGLSSSTQVSDGYDGREISLRATVNTSTTLATSGDTLIPYALGNGTTYDRVNGLASSIYTVPSSGRYKVSARVFLTGGQSWTNNDVVTLYAKVDNTTYFPLGSFTAQVTQTITNAFSVGGIVTLDLTAGQTIRIVSNNVLSATKSTQASVANYNSLEIEKLSSPTTISATEVVAARYKTNAALSIANTNAFVVVDFEDSESLDTFNAVTTGASWKFTAPYSGIYRVSATVLFDSQAWTAGNAINMRLFKEGSQYTNLFRWDCTTTATQLPPLTGYALVPLNAGQYIDVRLAHNRTGGNANLINDSIFNHINIERIK